MTALLTTPHHDPDPAARENAIDRMIECVGKEWREGEIARAEAATYELGKRMEAHRFMCKVEGRSGSEKSGQPRGWPKTITLWSCDGTATREFNTARLEPGNYALHPGERERPGYWTCPVCLFRDNEGEYSCPCRNCAWSMRWESP